MRRSHVLLLALTVAVGAVLVVASPPAWVGLRRPDPPPRTPAPLAPDWTVEQGDKTAQQFVDEVEGRFQLSPDKRFVQAFAEIETVLTGAPAEPPAAVLEEGVWTLRSGGSDVARVPEFPSFSDWMTALQGWSGRLLESAPRSLPGAPQIPPRLEDSLGSWDDATLIAALAETDARWRAGEATAADLAVAVRVLAKLSLLLADDLEQADRVPARALAALALGQHLHPGRFVREEVMLALALDHSRHAATRAASLSRSDPLVALVEQDDESLAALGSAGSAAVTREARQLVGLSLAYQGRGSELLAWWRALPREEKLSGLVFRSAYLSPTLKSAASVPDLALFASLVRFARECLLTDALDEDVLLGCAKKVRTRRWAASAEFPGPWVDQPFYDGFHRAFLLSAVYWKSEYYRESLGSIPAAVTFVERLRAVGDPDLDALADWYEPLADPRAPVADPEALIRALHAPSILGPRQREATLERLLSHQRFVERPDHYALIAQLSAHFDARPRHLLRVADLARNHFQDVRLAERLEAAALAADGPHHIWRQAWFAKVSGDLDELWRMADSPSREARDQALYRLTEMEDVDAARLERVYQRAWKRHPDALVLARNFAYFLAKHREDRARAREVLLDYLSRHPARSLAEAELLRRVSLYYRTDGRPDDAWETISPVLETYKASILDEGVRVLVDLDRREAAESLAHKLNERYPQSLWTYGTVAYVLWKQDRFDEAASVVRDSQRRASQNAHMLAFEEEFAGAFEKASPERTVAAFKAMVDAQVAFETLYGMILRTERDGRVRESHEMSTLAHSTSHEFLLYIAGYPGLRERAGREAAIDWLVERIEAHDLNAASGLFFERGFTELLWVPFEQSGVEPSAETWMWRAADAARGGEVTPAQRAALQAHYAGTRDGFDDELGAMLVGVLPREELLAQATTSRRICRAAFAIAMKARGDGQYREASLWLQVAIATRVQHVREYGLAHHARNDIAALGKSLVRLEREHEHGAR